SVGGGDLGPREWLSSLFGNRTHLPFQSLNGVGSFINPVCEALDNVQELLVLLFEMLHLVAKGLDVVVARVRSGKKGGGHRFSGEVQGWEGGIHVASVLFRGREIW